MSFRAIGALLCGNVLILASALLAAPAQAQATRTFVAPPPAGNDANPCTITQPCRFLQRALTQTARGGEIAVLGTAGYNNGATVNITQAVSIVNPGAFEAGLFVLSGGTGITINAAASDAVSLRGLTIEGGGVGENGITFVSAKSLAIQNCNVRNFLGSGIAMIPSTDSNIVVSNTVVSDNAIHGLFVQPTGKHLVLALFNHVEAYNNGGVGIGLYSNFAPNGAGLYGTAIDSVAAFNRTAGFFAYGQYDTSRYTEVPQFNLFRSSAYFNWNSSVGAYRGVRAENGGKMYVAQSNIMEDWWSIDSSNNYSLIESYGDNAIPGSAPSGKIPLN